MGYLLLVGLLRRGVWKSPVKNGTRTILIEILTTVWTFRVMIQALPQISETFFQIGLKLCCLREPPQLMFLQQWWQLDLAHKGPYMESENGLLFLPLTLPL